MIYQQSLSDIESVLTLWTPLQLVQQILRAKYQEDRMSNLYYRDFQKHHSPNGAGPDSHKIPCSDLLSYYHSQQILRSYNSMQEIIVEIKDIILSQASLDVFHPKLIDPTLNQYTAGSSRRCDNGVFSNKKLSIQTAATRKSVTKGKLKKFNLFSVKSMEPTVKMRCTSSQSNLSKMNHDLSQMIKDVCTTQTTPKNFTQKLPLPKVKNSNLKQKHLKRKILTINLSSIKPNQNHNIRDHEIDENYGLSTIKHKMSGSCERKRYKFKSKKNQQKSQTKKVLSRNTKSRNSTQEMFQIRSVERGALSPMTPKPRLLHELTKQTFWKDYSINNGPTKSRKSHSKLGAQSGKSQNKESQKALIRNGLVSPKNKPKTISLKEKQKPKAGKKKQKQSPGRS